MSYKGPEIHNPTPDQLKPGMCADSGVVLENGNILVNVGGTLEKEIGPLDEPIETAWQIYHDNGTPYTVNDLLRLHGRFTNVLKSRMGV